MDEQHINPRPSTGEPMISKKHPHHAVLQGAAERAARYAFVHDARELRLVHELREARRAHKTLDSWPTPS